MYLHKDLKETAVISIIQRISGSSTSDGGTFRMKTDSSSLNTLKSQALLKQNLSSYPPASPNYLCKDLQSSHRRGISNDFADFGILFSVIVFTPLLLDQDEVDTSHICSSTC